MSLNSIFQYLVPSDRKFIPFLESASSNLVDVSNVLYEMLTTSDPVRRLPAFSGIWNSLSPKMGLREHGIHP